MTSDATEQVDVVALRRVLHARAETAFREVATVATLLEALSPSLARADDVLIRRGAAALDPTDVYAYPSFAARQEAAAAAVALGCDPTVSDDLARHGTAFTIEVPGDRPGPTIGIRFDVDALPIVEDSSSDHLPAREGFASTTGAMHACGHDGHAAIGVALAERLIADRAFSGRVRFLFQPAEESVRGAPAMIAAGCADGLDVMIGLHLGEGLPARVLAAGSHGLQATEKLAIDFTGVSAHSAAAPQEGRNAIAAAATATLGLLAMSRDSRGVTNVNVGTIQGGRQSNIVPDHCRLEAEVRSDSDAVCASMLDRARRVVAGAAESWDVEHTLTRMSYASTMTSDAALVDHAYAAATSIDGVADVRRTALMAASDDLSLWARTVQDCGGVATYLVVGASSPAPHHHPRFDIDESALPVAVDWLERIVRTYPAGGLK
ncbi:MAG TPA: amidohydrolase [Propionibacteriaceae bacterium]|nr:amidohydrolase [Propionibacteriaceae bacterium]HQE32129.1 amidohydrolase [Propionibacteriaceae bacterium]